MTEIMPAHITEEGLALIKQQESLSLAVYQDPCGVWTIGYGHTGPDVTCATAPINEQQADNLLTRDVYRAERCIHRTVHVCLSPNQYNALVSFVFNIGIGAFTTSTLRARLNKRGYAMVPMELKRWVYGTVDGKFVKLPGLILRREAEIALWNS